MNYQKEKKKITFHVITSREYEGSALNQHSLLRAIGSQGGRGGGLSCQSHISAPKPQRLNKVELPETGRRSVTISPELALPSSFSFGEAQAQLKRTKASFKHPNRWTGRNVPRPLSFPTLRRSRISGISGAARYPLYRERRVPGPAGPETRSRLAPGVPRAPPAASSQGAASRAGEAALPAARVLLPSSLWPPGPCLCVKGVPSPVQDLTPRIAWPPASLQVLGEDLRGLQRRCRSHSPGAVKLPPPSPPQPACSGDPGTKRPRQPMAAGQRRPAANH